MDVDRLSTVGYIKIEQSSSSLGRSPNEQYRVQVRVDVRSLCDKLEKETRRRRRLIISGEHDVVTQSVK